MKKGGFTHILAGHSAFGKTVMPRAAALLDTQQISDIIKIESEDSESSNDMSTTSANPTKPLHGQSTPEMLYSQFKALTPSSS